MAFNPIFKGQRILETKNFRVEQDWEIPIPGFFVIAPKKKANSITDFSEDQSVEFIKIVRKVRAGMRDVLKIKDVYLFQGEGSKFGFHLWMFPRYNWMEEEENKGDPNLMIPVMRYAKKNMMDEVTISKVKVAVKKMKIYMSDF